MRSPPPGACALPIVADLSDAGCDRSAIVAQATAALGPIDVLVNNAAACFYLSIDDTSERRLRVAYEVNVITPYLLTKAVVPGMRDRGAGWIVNITSAIVDTESARQPAAGPLVDVRAEQGRARPAHRSRSRPSCRARGIAVNALAPERAVATAGATAVMELPPGVVRAGRDDGRRGRSRSPRAIPSATTVSSCGRVRTSARGGRSRDGRAGHRAAAAGSGRRRRVCSRRGARRSWWPTSTGDAAQATAAGDRRTAAAAVRGRRRRRAHRSRRWSRSRSSVSVGSTGRATSRASRPQPKPFVEHTYADWQRTIDVNLSGVFFCMQHELRQMLAQGPRRRDREHVVGRGRRTRAGSAAVHRGQARRARPHQAGGAGVRRRRASG